MILKKNKKGDLMTDALLILLLLVLFFLLSSPIDSLASEMTGFTSDSNVVWMLKGFTFVLLLGIFKYVLTSSREGGTTE